MSQVAKNKQISGDVLGLGASDMLRPIPNRENVVFIVGECLRREFLVSEFLAKADKFTQSARPNECTPVFHAGVILFYEFFELTYCQTKTFDILLADNVRYVRLVIEKSFDWQGLLHIAPLRVILLM